MNIWIPEMKKGLSAVLKILRYDGFCHSGACIRYKFKFDVNYWKLILSKLNKFKNIGVGILGIFGIKPILEFSVFKLFFLFPVFIWSVWCNNLKKYCPHFCSIYRNNLK